MREGREVGDWEAKAVLGKGRNRIKEHSCMKKTQMREERKRRSDKRKASTKEANKENPRGGINHCPTYPSSLRFLSFIERFGPVFSHSVTIYPFSSPTTVPLPPPPSIHPSFHPYICPSICPLKTTPTLSCLSLILRLKKPRLFMHPFVKGRTNPCCRIRAATVQL